MTISVSSNHSVKSILKEPSFSPYPIHSLWTSGWFEWQEESSRKTVQMSPKKRVVFIPSREIKAKPFRLRDVPMVKDPFRSDHSVKSISKNPFHSLWTSGWFEWQRKTVEISLENQVIPIPPREIKAKPFRLKDVPMVEDV